MTDALSFPATTRELLSTVDADGSVTLSVSEVAVPSPGPDEVIVRIEAAPINPSDLGGLFANADVSTSTAVGTDELPAVRMTIPTGTAGLAGRVCSPMQIGNEGGGTVVAVGDSDAARALDGKVVGFLNGAAYAQYRKVHVLSCLPVPDGTTAEQAAACFVNPLTALSMVETMQMEGHTGLVHTVGASNLGLMLNRICLADGVPLVNIVRQQEQADKLRSEGALHVVDSSTETFKADLAAALTATGATIAFDAIGGGDLASVLLTAMEKAAAAGAPYSRYGSDVHKQVYLYGSLDRSPTVLQRNFGMSWGVAGWLLTPFLTKLGREGADRLRQRVANEITTTFASAYGMRLSLADAVDPEHVQRYAKMSTGDKALLTPHA